MYPERATKFRTKGTILRKRNSTCVHQRFEGVCFWFPAPNSELSKAVNYFKNSCDELFTYLEDGHVECSNNIAERAVKSFVIMRKNFLFSKSELGANASATLFSIVQTARANALHPEAYITYLLENINKKKIDDLFLKVKLKA